MRYRVPNALVGLWLATIACGAEKLDTAIGDITVTPAIVDFGPEWVGGWAEREVEVRNSGRVEAVLALAGPTAPFEAPASLVVPPGATVRLPVSFGPTAAIAYADALVLSSENQKPVRVEVRGTAVDPALELSGEMNFGTVRCDRRLELPLRIRNRAELDVDELLTRLAGTEAQAFTIAREVRQVGAGEEATLVLAFEPAWPGPHAAALEVAACAGCRVTKVTLRGRGIEPDLVATPGELDFGAVAPLGRLALVTRLENRGEAPGTIREIRIAGEGFSVGWVELPAVLNEQDFLDIPVTFAPLASGEHEGTLTFVDELGTTALDVPLRGRGDVVVAAIPPTIDLGRRPVGWIGFADVQVSQLVPDLPVQVTDVRIEGSPAWSVAAPALPSEVGNSGVPLRLRFSGQAPGDELGELIVATSHPGQPELRVPLAARVVDDVGCRMEAQPNRVRFGLVSTGEAGAYYSRTVELVNVGDEPCIVWDVGLDPGGSPSFTLIDPPTDRELAPGERMSVIVMFWAQDPSDEVRTADLRFRTSSLLQAAGWIPVSGFAPFGRDLSGTGIPRSTDFGRVRIGREARQPVWAQTISPGPLLGANIASGSDPTFEIAVRPSFPTGAVAPWSPLVVEYVPRSVGRHRGELEVLVDGSPEPLIAVLEGEGVEGPCEDDCEPPVAGCPGPFEGVVGEAIQLAGSGHDPEGELPACEWTVSWFPDPGVLVPPAYPTDVRLPVGCAVSFTPPLAGHYTLRLRVTDATHNVAECATQLVARPAQGLWVERFWYPSDGGYLFNNYSYSAGYVLREESDPNDVRSWFSGTSLVCTDGSGSCEWDPPGTADDPFMSRAGERREGPGYIRISAPVPSFGYHLGFDYSYYDPPSQYVPYTASVATNVYCNGVLAASERTAVDERSFVFVGTVRFDDAGACAWDHAGVVLTWN